MKTTDRLLFFFGNQQKKNKFYFTLSLLKWTFSEDHMSEYVPTFFSCLSSFDEKSEFGLLGRSAHLREATTKKMHL